MKAGSAGVSGAPSGPKTDRMSAPKTPGNMKSSMPYTMSKGKLPSRSDARSQGSASSATGMKNGGAVKTMPSSMPHKGGCR